MKSNLVLASTIAAMALSAPAWSDTSPGDVTGSEPAGTEVVQEHVRIALSDAFYRQRARIEMNLQPGGRYGEITEDDRKEVLRALDTMESLIGEAASVEDMHPDHRAQLYNAQDRANTLLTAARADSRTECRRMRVVGSRFKQTVCETIAEWRRQSEAGQQAILSKQIGRVTIPQGQ